MMLNHTSAHGNRRHEKKSISKINIYNNVFFFPNSIKKCLLFCMWNGELNLKIWCRIHDSVRFKSSFKMCTLCTLHYPIQRIQINDNYFSVEMLPNNLKTIWKQFSEYPNWIWFNSREFMTASEDHYISEKHGDGSQSKIKFIRIPFVTIWADSFSSAITKSK